MCAGCLFSDDWRLLLPQALQHVMQGTGPAFAPHLDEPLLQLIYKCVTHPNRFVRWVSQVARVGGQRFQQRLVASLLGGCCCVEPRRQQQQQ